MLQLCAAIRDAGMHVGITVKPETEVELLFPYVDAGAVDMVRQGLSRARVKMRGTTVCVELLLLYMDVARSAGVSQRRLELDGEGSW